jgi:NuA3 HAT complex component NTO1
MRYRLDIKTFFTEGLTKIRSKLQQRFYTTILPFARDLSAVFSAGIGSEPPANPEAEVDTTSSPKKQTGDIKERKKLAKRIIKAIQPQLEVALRAEVEISGEPAEEQLKELKNLLEGSLEARQGSVSVSLGESGSQEDAEGDVVMTDAAHAKQNGIGQGGTDTSKSHDEDSNQKREADDVQMEDVDAPHEEEENIIVAVSSESTANAEPNGDTITTAALAEVNINKSPAKAQPTNGLKNTNASLDTSGHVSAPQVEQPNTAIQPVSNGYTNAEQGEKTLTDGGIPLFLKEDFQIEGVKVSEIVRESTRPSEELSEMDDDQLNDLENDYNNAANEETVAVIPVTKSKKAKSRKRR